MYVEDTSLAEALQWLTDARRERLTHDDIQDLVRHIRSLAADAETEAQIVAALPYECPNCRSRHDGVDTDSERCPDCAPEPDPT